MRQRGGSNTARERSVASRTERIGRNSFRDGPVWNSPIEDDPEESGEDGGSEDESPIGNLVTTNNSSVATDNSSSLTASRQEAYEEHHSKYQGSAYVDIKITLSAFRG